MAALSIKRRTRVRRVETPPERPKTAWNGEAASWTAGQLSGGGTDGPGFARRPP